MQINAATALQTLANVIRSEGRPVTWVTRSNGTRGYALSLAACDEMMNFVHAWRYGEDAEAANDLWNEISDDLRYAVLAIERYRLSGSDAQDWNECARRLLTAPEIAGWLDDREPTPHAERPADTLAEDAWHAQRMVELGWGTADTSTED